MRYEVQVILPDRQPAVVLATRDDWEAHSYAHELRARPQHRHNNVRVEEVRLCAP